MDDSPCLFWLVMNRWVKLRFEEVYVTRAGMITKGHLSVIKTYSLEGNVTNGSLLSLNSKVQLAKRRARGYSSVSNFMDMVYYINGGECFRYPHEST